MVNPLDRPHETSDILNELDKAVQNAEKDIQKRGFLGRLFGLGEYGIVKKKGLLFDTYYSGTERDTVVIERLENIKNAFKKLQDAEFKTVKDYTQIREYTLSKKKDLIQGTEALDKIFRTMTSPNSVIEKNKGFDTRSAICKAINDLSAQFQAQKDGGIEATLNGPETALTKSLQERIQVFNNTLTTMNTSNIFISKISLLIKDSLLSEIHNMEKRIGEGKCDYQAEIKNLNDIEEVANEMPQERGIKARLDSAKTLLLTNIIADVATLNTENLIKFVTDETVLKFFNELKKINQKSGEDLSKNFQDAVTQRIETIKTELQEEMKEANNKLARAKPASEFVTLYDASIKALSQTIHTLSENLSNFGNRILNQSNPIDNTVYQKFFSEVSDYISHPNPSLESYNRLARLATQVGVRGLQEVVKEREIPNPGIISQAIKKRIQEIRQQIANPNVAVEINEAYRLNPIQHLQSQGTEITIEDYKSVQEARDKLALNNNMIKADAEKTQKQLQRLNDQKTKLENEILFKVQSHTDGLKKEKEKNLKDVLKDITKQAREQLNKITSDISALERLNRQQKALKEFTKEGIQRILGFPLLVHGERLNTEGVNKYIKEIEGTLQKIEDPYQKRITHTRLLYLKKFILEEEIPKVQKALEDRKKEIEDQKVFEEKFFANKVEQQKLNLETYFRSSHTAKVKEVNPNPSYEHLRKRIHEINSEAERVKLTRTEETLEFLDKILSGYPKSFQQREVQQKEIQAQKQTEEDILTLNRQIEACENGLKQISEVLKVREPKKAAAE